MPCNCQPIPPPPPFDVPPPPDPSFVFHLLSDDPPEAFEKLHLLHSCPLQKHLFFFRYPFGRFLPFATVAAFLLLTSFSVTAFVFWRKRRRTRRMEEREEEEEEGREWRRKSEERKSGRREEEKEEGGKKRRKPRGKRRSTLRGNTPPSAVPPPSVRLQPHFNFQFPPVSSPSSDANFSCRSSIETVSSVPSPQNANEWSFRQFAVAESDNKIGSNVSVRSPTFATPPRRSVALRFPPNRHFSPDFVWRSSADFVPSNDFYEELAVAESEIAEAPYKWRRTLTPSASARRLPPPSSKPPPPPTECPSDWPTTIGHCSSNGSPNTEMNREQKATVENDVNGSRWRTSSDLLDRERESGYGTGRSGRRGRSQGKANGEENERRKHCPSTNGHPSPLFSPLPNMLIKTQPNGCPTTKKTRQMAITNNTREDNEKTGKSGEGPTKTMTYL